MDEGDGDTRRSTPPKPVAARWQKNLWKEQPYEDNHVDSDTFLNTLVTNGNEPGNLLRT